jgi:OPT family oligopeptide transporter
MTESPDRPNPGQVDQLEQEERNWLEGVYRGDRLPELSLRVVLVGLVLSVLTIVFNVYMGLKTGWGEGGAIISVILGFTIMKLFGQVDRKDRPFSELENNISQTMASASGSLGNIVNVIPAMFLLASAGIIARAPTTLDIILWCFFTSLLGVVFAIPLRKQIVVVEKLVFPTGTAAAKTIQAVHAHGEEALSKAKTLFRVAVPSFLITWFRDGWIGPLPHLPASWYPFTGMIPGVGAAQTYMAGLSISPFMLTGGFLFGPRVGTSLLIGGVIAWLVAAPRLMANGVLETIANDFGERYINFLETGYIFPILVKWTMWPAIGVMVSAGITMTAIRWPVIKRAFASMIAGTKTGGKGAISHLELSFKWLGLVFLFAMAGILYMLTVRFGVPWWIGILTPIMAFALSLIAVRATGETDINPVGTMGSITQIAFGLAQQGATTNLMAGGISASVASESADMMQDLKTGWLLGSTPRKLVIGQLLGVTAGAVFAAVVFNIMIAAHDIGSATLPAPAAITWEGLARMMEKGAGALPPGAGPALLIGILVGTVLTYLDGKKLVPKKYLPSAISVGLAMIVPFDFVVAMFLGGIAMLITTRRNPAWAAEHAALIGSGGIVGEGLAGVLAAITILATGGGAGH